MDICWEEVELYNALRGHGSWSDVAKLTYFLHRNDYSEGEHPQKWPPYENDLLVHDSISKFIDVIVKLLKADRFKGIKELNINIWMSYSAETDDMSDASVSGILATSAETDLHFYASATDSGVGYWKMTGPNLGDCTENVKLGDIDTDYDECLAFFKANFLAK